MPNEETPLANGWVQYECIICKGIVSAYKDSICAKYLVCDTCARKNSIDNYTGRAVDAILRAERLKEAEWLEKWIREHHYFGVNQQLEAHIASLKGDGEGDK